MIRSLVLWLDDRLGGATFARGALRKAFPDHWSFMLGEVAAYCLLVLIGTGIFLTFFFIGSGDDVTYGGPYAPLHGVRMSSAYASVMRLSFEVRAGLVMRQVHHWAALVFVAAIAAHLMRIFFTGAFRRPRELNWMIGTTLLILCMLAGFTGYSLPDDLLSGTGIRIAYSVLESIPVVGPWLAFLFFGGAFPTPLVMGRLFVIHVMLLPALIVGALTLHLSIVWHQKHTQFRGPGHTEANVVGSPLWPNYMMKSLGLAFAVFAILGTLGALAQINPIWLYGPYNPTLVAAPAQPDWYMGWLEGALRLFPAWDVHVFGHTIPGPFFPAVLLPVACFGLLYVWPFLEQWWTHDGAEHHLLNTARDVPWRTGVGFGALTFAAMLTLAGSNDVLARFFGIPVEAVTSALQVAVLVSHVLVGYGAYAIARELHDQDKRGEVHRRWSALQRNPRGGYEEAPGADAVRRWPEAAERAGIDAPGYRRPGSASR